MSDNLDILLYHTKSPLNLTSLQNDYIILYNKYVSKKLLKRTILSHFPEWEFYRTNERPNKHKFRLLSKSQQIKNTIDRQRKYKLET